MPEEASRGQWNSRLQFTLTCVGYAVGLGNIWRFPMLAYQNGGVAFLIPYVCCSFIIGFPLLYLELCLGQFTGAGPAMAFFKVLPIMQGLGLAMVTINVLVGIYYTVIVAWILNYLFSIVTGQSYRWARCLPDSGWNTASPDCQSEYNDEQCAPLKYFNFNCTSNETWIATGLEKYEWVSGTEEYYRHHILGQSASISDLNGMNWKLVIGLFVAWAVIAACLVRGVKWLGRISLFTATFPYLVVAILFVRAVTLDGAKDGLSFYLTNPDFSYIWKQKTWREAATQVSYSLSVGFGGLLTLASYNRKDHVCFQDAVIVTFADSLMSFFNGMAVFSVLGFMSNALGKPITEVISEGEGLAFIAYPEAISRMPVQWLWAFLFFVMIGMLGFTTLFGLIEAVNSAIFDQLPKLQRFRPYITVAVCLLLFLAGLIMCTGAGIYYFKVFNAYTASISLMLVIFLEVVVIAHVYGARNFILDLRSMFGEPQFAITRFFGPSGWYFAGIWVVVAPVFTLVMIFFTIIDQIDIDIDYGKPLGWTLSLLPIVFIPIYAMKNSHNYWQKGKPIRQLFRPHYTWPTFSRMHGRAGSHRVWMTVDKPNAIVDGVTTMS